MTRTTRRISDTAHTVMQITNTFPSSGDHRQNIEVQIGYYNFLQPVYKNSEKISHFNLGLFRNLLFNYSQILLPLKIK